MLLMNSHRVPLAIQIETSWKDATVTPRRGATFGCVRHFQEMVSRRNICDLREKLVPGTCAMWRSPCRKQFEGFRVLFGTLLLTTLRFLCTSSNIHVPLGNRAHSLRPLTFMSINDSIHVLSVQILKALEPNKGSHIHHLDSALIGVVWVVFCTCDYFRP